MIDFFLILTSILLILTLGCGFSIHYGGEAFKKGIIGHITLGILTMISFIVSLCLYFIS